MRLSRRRCVETWRRGERIVRALAPPDPFDLGRFVDRVSAVLGVGIELRAASFPDSGLTGFAVQSKDKLTICYAKETTEAHQEHIVCHECAHFLCGHSLCGHSLCGHGGSGAEPGPVATLLPDLDPELIRRVVPDSRGYSAAQEQEAELVAALVLASGGRRAAPPRPLDVELESGMRQLRVLFGAAYDV